MTTVSYLITRLTSRYEEDDPARLGDKNTIFADILIDGNSLYQKLKMYDLVPAFGWGSEQYQRLMMDYFLLKYSFELMYHRYPILVCPWCGDLECGYISVSIDRESLNGAIFSWNVVRGSLISDLFILSGITIDMPLKILLERGHLADLILRTNRVEGHGVPDI